MYISDFVTIKLFLFFYTQVHTSMELHILIVTVYYLYQKFTAVQCYFNY